MAKVSRVNLQPVTGADAMFMLMEFLRDDMGFTITRSGDGLSAFDATGTSVITHGGSGANGMENVNAHWTARDPGGQYEWCVQENSTVSMEVVISALDGFTGGSATVRPTATDEQVLVNTTFFTTSTYYRWHITGDTTPVGSAVPVYPWRAWSMDASGPDTFIGHEPLKPGSYPELVGTRASPTTGEPDPSVYICKYDPECFQLSVTAGAWAQPLTSINSSGPAFGWYCMNDVNGQTEAFTRFQAGLWVTGPLDGTTSHVIAPGGARMHAYGGCGPDPRDGSDPIFEVFVSRPQVVSSTFTGPKGILSSLRMSGTNREWPSVVDVGGERYVHIQDLLIPYENGGLPL